MVPTAEPRRSDMSRHPRLYRQKLFQRDPRDILGRNRYFRDSEVYGKLAPLALCLYCVILAKAGIQVQLYGGVG